MPLESANYIAGLATNWPVGGDVPSSIDDHLRLIKTVVKGTFPNLDGEVSATPSQMNKVILLDSLTEAQVGYLQDLTASAQAQLNAKLALSGTAADAMKLNGRELSYVLSLSNATGNIVDNQHGQRGRGNMHLPATQSEAGFQSAADKQRTDAMWASFQQGGESAAAILAKLLDVDGGGSNLDADLLDGQHGDFYRDLSNATGPLKTLLDALAAGVKQSHLKTSTGELSINGTGSQVLPVTLPGGQYGFWPLHRLITSSLTSSGGYIPGWAEIDATTHAWETGNKGVTGDSGYGAIATLAIFGGGISTTNVVHQRYVSSSPPYDLGNGDVPLFTFGVMNASGEIYATYVAEDPPWGNNGPVDVRPDYYRDGVGYKRIVRRRFTQADLDAGRCTLKQYLEQEPQEQEIEVTREFKNANMAHIPHPWYLKPCDSVVLLDPVSRLMEQLREVNRSDESVCELIYKGYVKVKAERLDAAAPPGVKVLRAAWKRTRRL